MNTAERREPRMPVEFHVRLSNMSSIRYGEERVSDLSRNGAFIEMNAPCPSGIEVAFEIQALEDEVIRGIGRVAWSTEDISDEYGLSGIGVEFVNLSDDSRSLLEKVLAEADAYPV